MNGKVITNIILIALTIFLFVTEEGWYVSLLLLILYNLWQTYGSEERAEQLYEWYFKLFFSFGIIIAPYYILTEQFRFSDKRAVAVSISIALMILLLIGDNSLNKKIEDRTSFEKMINKIFGYTLFPIMTIYHYIVFWLLIAFGLFGWLFEFLGEVFR